MASNKTKKYRNSNNIVVNNVVSLTDIIQKSAR